MSAFLRRVTSRRCTSLGTVEASVVTVVHGVPYSPLLVDSVGESAHVNRPVEEQDPNGGFVPFIWTPVVVVGVG